MILCQTQPGEVVVRSIEYAAVRVAVGNGAAVAADAGRTRVDRQGVVAGQRYTVPAISVASKAMMLPIDC